MNPLIHLALSEDLGPGDVTTSATVPQDRHAKGVFLTRETLTLAGTDLLPEIYQARGGVSDLQLHHKDGETLPPNTTIATVRGKAHTLLECERTALNFLQRLSGIATLAHAFTERVAHTKCRILDTRKTTPGFRTLEKAAARAGGVTNHRMGLYDAVLIKNNHIAAAGGVTQAIAAARAASKLPIEIEVRTPAELEEALAAGADHLLLDNLTPREAKDWIVRINKRAKVELSGGITLETVRDYADTGADFISVGAITHSARAVDISFRLELV
ncbi:MAG TPA: carboxylating nicotinate-nucleotide diphosphorylase [Bryobacteraceae bacterium]|nr:carboxylating nicotinate-nucleotide diphosphorylase [Bryobacteraceae bacterium]